MNHKVINVTTLLIMASNPEYAFTYYAGFLGTSTTARDVILFKCSAQPGITVRSVSAHDGPVINPAAKIKVQIAKATSAQLRVQLLYLQRHPLI
ncbi:MAG: hypothetical protein ABL933_16570 [Methyloglobulus sp.]